MAMQQCVVLAALLGRTCSLCHRIGLRIVRVVSQSTHEGVGCFCVVFGLLLLVDVELKDFHSYIPARIQVQLDVCFKGLLEVRVQIVHVVK